MAFFDNFGKKISDAGQGAAQSFQNQTTLLKLNSTVKEEEKSIDNLYYQIGKLYYEKNSINPDDDYVNLVSGINQALANINNCKEQIKEIKGVTNCPGCGAEVPYTSAFCNTCGTKMPPRVVHTAVPAGAVECPACHNFVNANNKFCTFCGNVMAAAPAPVAAPVAEAPVFTAAPAAPVAEAPIFTAAPSAPVAEAPVFTAAPAAPVAEAPVFAAAGTKTCPSCGKELDVEAMFCTNCGHSF